MVKQIFATSLLLAVVVATTAADSTPRVNRSVLNAAEKSLDDRIKLLWEDNPLALVGPTRGVYLEGYGAVFTAEINPISGPIALMHSSFTKEEKDRYKKKRLERIPQLEAVLKQTLVTSAASLDPVPVDEQVVIVVDLSHNPWEDVTGLPGQVMVQASKRKLLEAQRAGAGGAAMLDQAIRVTRY
jgi:hypothetical protein